MRGMTLALVALATVAYAPQALGAEEYTLDQAHTTVGFSVKHMVIASVKGKFNDFDAIIMFDETDLTKTAVTGTIKVASIDTGNDKRDDHLRSEDFFNAAEYPEITFKSKKVEKRESGYVMIGDITMRGVTKEIEVPFELVGKITDPWGNVRIGLAASAELNRQDFGLSWSQALETGGLVVANEVKIELDVEAIKKSEEK